MIAVATQSMTSSVPEAVDSNGESRESPLARPSEETMEDSDDDVPLSVRKEKAQQMASKIEHIVKKEPAPGSFEAALLPKSSPKKPTITVKIEPPVTPIKVTAVVEKKEEKKEEDSEDDVPLSLRIGRPPTSSNGKASTSSKRKRDSDDDEDEEYSPQKKKEKKPSNEHKEKKHVKKEKKVKIRKKTIEVEVKVSPSKTTVRKKKEEETEEVWKWWEEERRDGPVKWKTLEHRGPVFAPPYQPLPSKIHFKYNGEVFKLAPEAEEVAGFYAKMLDHEYVTKEAFNKNFFKDWRKQMNSTEREKITDLTKCDFSKLAEHFRALTEERKAMSKEEKLKLKEEKDKEQKHYGFAWIDGHKQKIGNYRIEPPGLFRGRGSHPKMGKLKKRVTARDITINCSQGSKIPDPPSGEKWREVRHDNTVTWLCSWTENVLGQNKYIMLNPSSKIKLALRAGNEKDSDEAADTVGCCSLRCEHIKLYDHLDGKDYVIEFDFLGKDSIRYFNQVPVEKRVFNNLKLFMEKKDPSDDLFDRLDTSSLNSHLDHLMKGLTVKVFRTYNASITLQQQLDKLTKAGDSIHDKILAYNRANRQVAILCNHQRSIPKTHEKSMENLENKIKEKKKELKEAKGELNQIRGEGAKLKAKKKLERITDQLKRLKIQRTDKDENKQIALGTSKLNYLDPRISVAWCKKHKVPIEKVYNKTQREKFRWAIDMTDEKYVF